MTMLTFTILWANSAEDKLLIFFLFFQENRIWHFMQIVSIIYEEFQNFLSENFYFLVVKFTVYLNRRVFVMDCHIFMEN